MTPKIIIHFKITGNFNPDELTEAVCLNPTNTWKSGEMVKNTLIVHKYDGWKLSTPEIHSHDLSTEINNIILLIAPYKLQLTNFCNKYHLNTEFSCVLTIEDDEFPSIHFDKELLNNLKSFNAEIDIDIY